MLSMSRLLQNAIKPFLILHHYKSGSISLSLCFWHPLLAVQFPPHTSLISNLLLLILLPPFLPLLCCPHIFSSLTPSTISSLPRQVITKPSLELLELVLPGRQWEMQRESVAFCGWHKVTQKAKADSFLVLKLAIYNSLSVSYLCVVSLFFIIVL